MAGPDDEDDPFRSGNASPSPGPARKGARARRHDPDVFRPGPWPLRRRKPSPPSWAWSGHRRLCPLKERVVPTTFIVPRARVGLLWCGFPSSLPRGRPSRAASGSIAMGQEVPSCPARRDSSHGRVRREGYSRLCCRSGTGRRGRLLDQQEQ